MKQEGLKFFTDTDLTMVGMFLFLSTFIALLFWIYRKNSTEFYSKIEQLPLKDGE